MKLKEAINRIRFTISGRNKPNDNDVEAFNVLAEYLKEVEEKTIQDNLLFAKLYMYLLGKLVSYYNNAEEANKHIGKLLSQKTDNLIGILQTELQAMELRQIIPDPVLNCKASEIPDKIKSFPKFQQEFESAWDLWDNDNVRSHINTQINLSIQRFKNYD